MNRIKFQLGDKVRINIDKLISEVESLVSKSEEIYLSIELLAYVNKPLILLCPDFTNLDNWFVDRLPHSINEDFLILLENSEFEPYRLFGYNSSILESYGGTYLVSGKEVVLFDYPSKSNIFIPKKVWDSMANISKLKSKNTETLFPNNIEGNIEISDKKIIEEFKLIESMNTKGFNFKYWSVGYYFIYKLNLLIEMHFNIKSNNKLTN